MADTNASQSGAGCLARVFTIIGAFLLVSTVAAQVRGFSDGRAEFELTGGIIPGLVLLAMGTSLRRRARSTSGEEGRVPIPLKTTPVTSPAKVKAPPPPPPAPPVLEIPELPPVDETYRPGELPALDELDLDDFDPGKPMSSEERIRIAKEKYRKKT